MRTTLAGFVVVIVSLTAVLLGAQSEPPAVNPLAGNADAIQSGMGLFRSRCADCHGMDARGVRGPDLTQVWASGRSDGGLFRTLRRGVPGTEMPSVGPRTPDDEIWKILAYLKTIAAPTASDVEVGNAQNGERVFRAQCAGCHTVNGTGGRLGPDLSRIGSARARGAIVRRVRGEPADELIGVPTEPGEHAITWVARVFGDHRFEKLAVLLDGVGHALGQEPHDFGIAVQRD